VNTAGPRGLRRIGPGDGVSGVGVVQNRSAPAAHCLVTVTARRLRRAVLARPSRLVPGQGRPAPDSH